MTLLELRLGGFGKLADRQIAFDPTFNVIVGDNEAGKSTVASAILALLYGLGRGEKDRFRPWTAPAFAARLTYALADGRTFEVQRDFDRDSKGVRVYDEHGNDASGECSVGRTISPGEAHLGIPLEVFTNASFLAQGDVSIDGSRAERITHSLSRALDGGPREDAALGAIGRLDAAIAEFVGRKRATVNAPLRRLHDEIVEAEARASDMRERLRALDDLRARLEAERARALELEASARRQEIDGRSLRAYALRTRLDALRDVRDDLSALSAQRAQYDDVEAFPEGNVRELETLYAQWTTAASVARAQADEAERGRMTPAIAAELDEREADGGAIDDDAFAALRTAAREATEARDRSTETSELAQAARRNVDGGSELFGALVAAAALLAVAGTLLAILGHPPFAAASLAIAAALFAVAGFRWNRRRRKLSAIAERQREADEAVVAERAAAARVAAVLGPLGIASIDELARRRERLHELRARKTEGLRLASVASQTRHGAGELARAFDALAGRIVRPSGSRLHDLEAARYLESRKRTRDGVDVRLSMLDVRRNDLLGDDDEFALEAELADLLAGGVEPHPPLPGGSARLFEAQRADVLRRAAEADRLVAALEAALATSEAGIGDLAALDERTASLRERARELERFEAAIDLARTTIDARTKEALQKFARRLSDYASRAFSDVTHARYADIRIDPTTLSVRVRAPESDAIVDIDRLSAGTREQAYLTTRLAMAQMFSEGLEPAPILLDDPFAFWDGERIERGLPILETIARSGVQLTIFTSSRAFAAAAARRGARTIELPPTRERVQIATAAGSASSVPPTE